MYISISIFAMLVLKSHFRGQMSSGGEIVLNNFVGNDPTFYYHAKLHAPNTLGLLLMWHETNCTECGKHFVRIKTYINLLKSHLVDSKILSTGFK